MKYRQEISCKAIIFDESRTKILICYYGESEAYGLVGGHVERGEDPDETVKREIREEIGVEVTELKHFDFIQHPQIRIILLYTCTLPESSQLKIDYSELQSVRWINAEDIVTKKYDVGCYQPVLERAFNLTS